jgi:hypothetical protein
MSIEIFEIGLWIYTFEFWEGWFKIRKFMNITPITWSRSTMELEYFKDLINL